ncbi:MAG: efflux RND transporter periplasmic adaptor subunit [Rickettsiales bacterium]
MNNKLIIALKDKKYAKPIIIVLVLIAFLMIYRESHTNNNLKIEDDIPVEIAIAKTTDLPLYANALGTVTPQNIVNIKTQVNGILTNLAFEDGAFVKEGDLLVQIDPRMYEAQLLQYEGQLIRDTAILENSVADLKRYKDLWKQNSVSKQTLDTQIALVKQNEGVVLLDEGLVVGAEVNLSYCNIRAPFSGRLGIANVTAGSLVQNSDQTPIVTLTSLDPILVIFPVPETEIGRIIPEFNKQDLVVEVYDQTFTQLLSTGKLIAVDNQIDTSTGTVKLEAVFTNSDYNLFPNQFVNVKLLIKTLKGVVTVPVPAIQFGPNGTFVYLVNEDKTQVTVKPVVVGAASGTSVVISQGLDENDMIVTSGVDKLRDGSSIKVSNIGF